MIIFVKSSKAITSTVNTGTTCIPPIRYSPRYIAASSNNFREDVLVSFERPDIIQINKLSFYNNRVSNPISST